jgi:hypothetical protein
MAVRAEVFKKDFQHAANQLVYVLGGYGSRANSKNNSVNCQRIVSDRPISLARNELLGEVRDEFLDDWLKERIDIAKERIAAKQFKSKKARNDAR